MALPLSELRQVIWLTRMAAAGCAHENRSAWAAQLLDDAARLQRHLEHEEREERKALRRRLVGR